ncbi:MAG: hypothetical protein ACREX4_24875, partial [Gammaproteobacteria bacterium]
MSQLAEQAGGFAPTKGFFRLLSFPLTDLIASMPRRSCIDVTAKAPTVQIRCDVGREAQNLPFPLRDRVTWYDALNRVRAAETRGVGNHQADLTDYHRVFEE